MLLIKKLLPVAVLLLLFNACNENSLNPSQSELSIEKSETPIIGEDGKYVLKPTIFHRDNQEPTISSVFFTPENLQGIISPYFISIINGDGDGNGAVSSAIISIDGSIVFSQSDFNKKIRSLLSEIIITEASELVVELRGQPGSNITISVEGTKKPYYDRLFLWNKLGSTDELNNSPVGPNLSTLSPSNFQLAKFGNGVNPTNANQIPTIPASTFLEFMPNPLLQPWTFELWFKPQYSVTNNRITSNIPYGRSHIIVANCWRWGPNNSLGGIRIMPIPAGPNYNLPTDVNADIVYYHNDGSWTVIRPDVVDNDVSWEIGELVHMAVVYDPNGIDGGDTMFRLYINGILHCHSNETVLNDYANPIPGWPFKIGGSEAWHAYGVVDNIKIYDLAKTDFSDRQFE